MDLGGDYRDLYVKRVQNLEKVKRKLQQFPSLSVESLTESIAVHPAVYQLQNAMVSDCKLISLIVP